MRRALEAGRRSYCGARPWGLPDPPPVAPAARLHSLPCGRLSCRAPVVDPMHQALGWAAEDPHSVHTDHGGTHAGKGSEGGCPV